MILKGFMSLVCILFTHSMLLAETLDNYLSSFLSREIIELLYKEKRWSLMGESTHIEVPQDLKTSIKKSFSDFEPNLVIQALFLTKNTLKNLPLEGQLKELQNILRKVSQMKGIEYFSPSRQKMRLLYKQSYAINDPQNTQEPIRDPIISSLSLKDDKVYIFQEDLTFGKNIYLWTYSSNYRNICLSSVNITPLKYWGFSLVNPEGLKTMIFVIPFSEEILFYSLSYAKTIKFLGLEKSKKESFYQRMEALFHWFENQLKKKSSI